MDPAIATVTFEFSETMNAALGAAVLEGGPGALGMPMWDGARVTDIMTRYSELARVGPDDELGNALELLQEREVNQLPVVEEDGRTVVGVLTRTGILRLVDTRLKLGV